MVSEYLQLVFPVASALYPDIKVHSFSYDNDRQIKRSKDYRKVPIATINESSPLNGSDAIIDGLLARKNVYLLLQKRWGDSNDEGPKMTLETFQNESAQQWVQFANDELAPLLYPNMCRTLQDSYRAFGYVDQVEEFSPLQRLAIKGAGSLAMYAAASKVKSTYAINTAMHIQ